MAEEGGISRRPEEKQCEGKSARSGSWVVNGNQPVRKWKAEKTLSSLLWLSGICVHKLLCILHVVLLTSVCVRKGPARCKSLSKFRMLFHGWKEQPSSRGNTLLVSLAGWDCVLVIYHWSVSPLVILSIFFQVSENASLSCASKTIKLISNLLPSDLFVLLF